MNYVEKESEKKVEQLCNCVQNYNVTYYYTDVHKLCEAKKKIFFWGHRTIRKIRGRSDRMLIVKQNIQIGKWTCFEIWKCFINPF